MERERSRDEYVFVIFRNIMIIKRVITESTFMKNCAYLRILFILDERLLGKIKEHQKCFYIFIKTTKEVISCDSSSMCSYSHFSTVIGKTKTAIPIVQRNMLWLSWAKVSPSYVSYKLKISQWDVSQVQVYAITIKLSQNLD